MPVTIRPATLDDLSAIVALEQGAASAAHWSPERYQTRIADGHVWLAEREDGVELRGFICAQVVAGEWEIENIAVAEEFQRRGIAGRLLRAVLREARHAGASAVLLEVRESNAAARSLYVRNGFRETGRRREYYRSPVEDGVLYRFDGGGAPRPPADN